MCLWELGITGANLYMPSMIDTGVPKFKASDTVPAEFLN